MFCEEERFKLTRHLKRKHKDEATVAEALERIRLRGDYHHNCNVLALDEGEMIVVRNPAGKHPSNPSSFLPCPDCLSFVKGDELWRHNNRFLHKTSELKKWKTVQLEAKFLLLTGSISTANVDKEQYSNVISAMKYDSISIVARHDKVILQFGAAILEKVGRKNANYISQRMCQLAGLLLKLRARSHEKEAAFENFIDTSKFDNLIEAVKELCGFNHES